MFKKIAAGTAVFALAAFSLTGCGGGKLSTEETCTYINDEVGKLELQKKAEEATPKIMAGDMSGYVDLMNEFDGVLTDAAGKTKDSKLSDALKAASEQSQEMAKIMSDGDGDLLAISQKVTEMTTDENQKGTEYLNTACPEMSSFN